MSLSEKSWKVVSDPSNTKYDLRVIDIKDVKEFISELKEELKKNCLVYPQIIDKLAGEELI